MKASSAAQGPEPKLFLPSRRDALVLALAGAALLGTALFLRYGIIQNTPLGLACEAGRGGFVCRLRLAVTMAATFRAFAAGRKIQIEKLIALMDSILNATGGFDVPAALELLKTQADLLSTDSEPEALDHLRRSFPKLPSSETHDLKTSVDVALQAVKFDFVQRVKEFEKRNAQSKDRQFRAWLRGVRLGYEQWLARLSNVAGHS